MRRIRRILVVFSSWAISTASSETRMRMRHFLCVNCSQDCEKSNDVRLEPPERPPTASTDNFGQGTGIGYES